MIAVAIAISIAGTISACGASPSSSSSSPATKKQEPLGANAKGKPLPEADLKLLSNGTPLHIPTKKPTILAFWATWGLGPRLLAKLEEVYQRTGPQNIDVIAISIDDDPKDVFAAATKYGVTFQITWLPLDKRDLYTIATEPFAYILDQDGVVRFTHFGYHDNEDRQMEMEVRSLMHVQVKPK